IGSSTAGNTLTLGGNISNVNSVLSSNLTFTGAGNVTVNGSIQTSPAVAGALVGNYYNTTNPNTGGGIPLNLSNPNSLFFQTPTVTEPITGSTAGGMIDLPNIDVNNTSFT